MATRTITVREEAYAKLRAARRYEGESFSQVILRASWPEETVTAAELLEHLRQTGPHFSEDALDRIEAAKKDARPPEDKWTRT
jgi:predicted CopG family antitoxin